jgi:hypothetical protein
VPTIIKDLPYDSDSFYENSVDPQHWPSIRLHQIWLSVSITVPEKDWEDFDPKPPRFYALLDIGYSGNFSIRQKALEDLAHLEQRMLVPVDSLPINGKDIPHFDANVWIHRNKPASRDEALNERPFCLALNGGVAVFKKRSRPKQWPPLLGLKALDDNGIQLLIDGERGLVSMRTRSRVIT